jgi:hypothetical protein
MIFSKIFSGKNKLVAKVNKQALWANSSEVKSNGLKSNLDIIHNKFLLKHSTIIK